MWLRKHPQDLFDYPDLAVVKRRLNYISLTVS